MLRPLPFFLLLLTSLTPAFADLVELSAALPRESESAVPLLIPRLQATTTIRGALARTSVEMSLTLETGKDSQHEGRLLLTLPPACVISGAALNIGEEMRPASLVPPSTGQAAYNDVVWRNIDPCLIRLLPDGRVSVQVFPVTAKNPRRLRLEFSQLLSVSGPGLSWTFPLKFPQPVPEAELSLNTSPETETRPRQVRNFTGGSEWFFSTPRPSPVSPWPADPGPDGRFHYQGLLAVAEPPAPRHLLVLVDSSRLQNSRDPAAELALLTGLLRKMGSGQVTLAAFSTFPEAPATYELRDGKCDELLKAMDRLEYTGAPRPGAVDVSAIPADLVLISSTLADPMGSGPLPRLPPKVPVLIMNTVSAPPASAAVRLAEESGGQVIDPRLTRPALWLPPGWQAPLDPGSGETTAIARLLPGGTHWLITGSLSNKAELPAAGLLPGIVRGHQDTAAAQLLAEDAAQRHLLHSLESNPLARQAAGSSSPALLKATVLGPETALIVLEKLEDYRSHGIPLPNDTAAAAEAPLLVRHEWSGQDYPSEVLTRPDGSAGNPKAWSLRLPEVKARELRLHKWRMDSFQARRSTGFPMPAELEGLLADTNFKDILVKAEEAVRALPKLAEAYREEPGPDTAADLILQARAHQFRKLELAWYVEMLFEPMFKPGSEFGANDPFGGYSLAEDFFYNLSGKNIAARNNGKGSPPEDPEARTVPAGPDPDWQPQPASSLSRLERVAATTPQSLSFAPAKASDPEGKPQNSPDPQAGKVSQEALRRLSEISLGNPDHGRLRLLAWQCLACHQAVIALEVLQLAERKFGITDTTQRDLALALVEAGKMEAAASHIIKVNGGVARREGAALLQSPSFPSSLRLVLECADAHADADLEIEGPDYELANWKNPLPSFGGALSFDGTGFEPEDFILPADRSAALSVRIRLTSEKPCPVRLTIFHHWGQADQRREVFLFPECPPGLTKVAEIPAES